MNKIYNYSETEKTKVKKDFINNAIDVKEYVNYILNNPEGDKIRQQIEDNFFEIWSKSNL